MLVSHPFATNTVQDDDQNALRYSFTGGYPVNSFLEWHNGVHLVAPVDNSNGRAPVRAVADGTVVHVRPPQTVSNPEQNYGAFTDRPEWTDNGMVVVEHALEIGANDSGPLTIAFFSVYMHLKSLAQFEGTEAKRPSVKRALAKGDLLFRKQEIGSAGQIYGQDAHLHFEICMDEPNLRKLIGRKTSSLSAIDDAPTSDGRTDAVWGSTYVYLPTGTPVSSTEPRTHAGTPRTSTLGKALWIEIAYAGNATLTSYFADGDKAGEPISGYSHASSIVEPDGEYDLYARAKLRHSGNSPVSGSQVTRSGWYDLLRFGRALAPNARIATGTEHWRKIRTPAGDVWADLNAPGTFKSSDADFPSFLGWQCVGDDADGGNALDQRCDSPTLRSLLARQIADLTQRESALAKTMDGRRLLARQALQPRNEHCQRKLSRLVCKFPTEFDRNTVEARYAHVKEEPHFKNDRTGKSWEQLKAHIEAICCADLPDSYRNAQWHFHPIAFIEHIGQCPWLQKSDLKRIFTSIKENHLTNVCDEINKSSLRHFLDTALRQAHFFGQVRQEAGAGMKSESEDLRYSPQTLKSKFAYYRINLAQADSDGYEKDPHGKTVRPALQENIANRAYGGRNGNLQPGDGWLYRGRGMKQLTGKDNYEKFSGQYDWYWPDDSQDFVVSPDLLTQAKYGVRSAVWFWISNRCMTVADKGSQNSHIDSVTAIVNRGELGTRTESFPLQSKVHRRIAAFT